MKTLLITGFEPFGGEEINPSWEAVLRLPEEIGGYHLSKMQIPVVFGEAADTVIKVADILHPHVILCIGQAGGRSMMTPEMVGINLRHGRIPDNQGNQPQDQPCVAGGENAYFTTLPVRRMADAINAAGVPSQVSYSAGAYVCNDLLYTLLSHYKESDTRVGFLHLPYSTEQNKTPSMELDQMIKGLTAAIEALDGGDA